jgi:hypothetical protein
VDGQRDLGVLVALDPRIGEDRGCAVGADGEGKGCNWRGVYGAGGGPCSLAFPSAFPEADCWAHTFCSFSLLAGGGVFVGAVFSGSFKWFWFKFHLFLFPSFKLGWLTGGLEWSLFLP